ncbi:MAG: hypothetical protein NVS4B12_21630 [Ktedonobacteraceae bacterium]
MVYKQRQFHQHTEIIDELEPFLQNTVDPEPQIQHNYYPDIYTFRLPAIPTLSTQPMRVVSNASSRWKILVILSAILLISLTLSGIFLAYLIGPFLNTFFQSIGL